MPYHENMFGGLFDRRYIDHQFAFVGTAGPMFANDLMLIGRIDLRYRIGKNFFVSAIANVLYTNSVNKLERPVLSTWPNGDDPIWNEPLDVVESIVPNTEFWIRGFGLEVAYKSLLGPISFDLMWNDVTKRVSAYFNIGYFF